MCARWQSHGTTTEVTEWELNGSVRRKLLERAPSRRSWRKATEVRPKAEVPHARLPTPHLRRDIFFLAALSHSAEVSPNLSRTSVENVSVGKDTWTLAASIFNPSSSWLASKNGPYDSPSTMSVVLFSIQRWRQWWPPLILVWVRGNWYFSNTERVDSFIELRGEGFDIVDLTAVGLSRLFRLWRRFSARQREI